MKSKLNKINPRNFTSSRIVKIAGVFVLIFIVFSFLNSSRNNNSDDNSSTSVTEVKEAIASQTINKEFVFPIKDKKNFKLGEVRYEIIDVEIRDELVINGKKRSTADGRVFLVVSLKIKSDFDKAIQVASRDYIRLLVEGKEDELLAPGIDNDPVTVQAISTQPARVAFIIDDTSNGLKLQVGEIKGEKTIIELEIKP